MTAVPSMCLIPAQPQGSGTGVGAGFSCRNPSIPKDLYSLSLRQPGGGCSHIPSSWPFSQIRSSVKSLLMAAAVVVFNWERKRRAPRW